LPTATKVAIFSSCGSKVTGRRSFRRQRIYDKPGEDIMPKNKLAPATRQLFLLLLVMTGVAAAGCGDGSGGSGQLSRSNFDRVQPGMTRSQVEKILGKPTSVQSYNTAPVIPGRGGGLAHVLTWGTRPAEGTPPPADERWITVEIDGYANAVRSKSQKGY
jgi:hypothetical protein